MNEAENINDNYISILNNSGFLNVNDTQSFSKNFEEVTVLPNNSKSHCVIIKAKKFGKWHIIKRLKIEYASNPFYTNLLEKEFEIGYHLDHPNVIKTISKEYDANGMYIVIEYVDGITLGELLQTKNMAENLPIINKLINEINAALVYIHSKQIIHRDLKPENILLTHNGNNVKIIDFGLSDADAYYMLKDPAGTKKYSAPEQLEKKNKISYKADYFALGKILEEIFSKSAKKTPSNYRKIIKGCTNTNVNKRFSNDDINKLIVKPDYKMLGYIIIAILITSTIVLYISSNYLFNKTLKFNNDNEFLERFKSNKLSDDEVITKSEILGYSWIDSLNYKIPDFESEPDYNKIGGWLNIFKNAENGTVSKWIKLENELKNSPHLYQKCKLAYINGCRKANFIFLQKILNSSTHRFIYINSNAFYKLPIKEQMSRLMKYQSLIDSTQILSLQGNQNLSRIYHQKTIKYYNNDINVK